MQMFDSINVRLHNILYFKRVKIFQSQLTMNIDDIITYNQHNSDIPIYHMEFD